MRKPALIFIFALFSVLDGCVPRTEVGEKGNRPTLPPVQQLLDGWDWDLAAMPGVPVTLAARVGGPGFEDESGVDYFMVSVTAPVLNRLTQPPREWVILLDERAAMQGRSWDLAKAAAQRLLLRLRPQDRVALAGFADRGRVHTSWVAPAEAAAALEKLAGPSAETGSIEAGLVFLADGLLTKGQEGQGLQTGVLVSNLAGAGHRLVEQAGQLTAAGALVHVICPAGGDDAILAPLGRMVAGRAIYLADERDISWHLGECFFKRFDPVALDLQVSLWFDGDDCLSPVIYAFPFQGWLTVGDPAAQLLGGKGEVLALPGVAALGSGESRLWIFPIVQKERGTLPAIRVRAAGRLVSGESFVLSAQPDKRYTVSEGRAASGAYNQALRKAIQMTALMDCLRSDAARSPTPAAAVQKRIGQYAALLNQMASQVSDANIDHDARILKAMSGLGQEQIAELRARAGAAPCASLLPEGMQSHGFPWQVARVLVFGGR